MSTGTSARQSRNVARVVAVSARSGSTRSQAIWSQSQSMPLAPTASEAICATCGVRLRAAGWEMSVAMTDMAQSEAGVSDGLIKGAILIAGPTASGKSAFALELARRTGGCIVNADSMQVYSVLNALTARPGTADLQ